MQRITTHLLASVCLGLLALAGCATDGQMPAQASAGPPAKAVSGKWAATSQSNWGDTSRCGPTMEVEATATDGKVRAAIRFGTGGRYNVEAAQQPDGSFETHYVSSRGDRINVTGQLADTKTVMSVWNPNSCGYRNVALKG
jgi:hypothetical protein